MSRLSSLVHAQAACCLNAGSRASHMTCQAHPGIHGSTHFSLTTSADKLDAAIQLQVLVVDRGGFTQSAAIRSSLVKKRSAQAAVGQHVRLMRPYRIGELPDIQRVSAAAFLSPLGMPALGAALASCACLCKYPASAAAVCGLATLA